MYRLILITIAMMSLLESCSYQNGVKPLANNMRKDVNVTITDGVMYNGYGQPVVVIKMIVPLPGESSDSIVRRETFILNPECKQTVKFGPTDKFVIEDFDGNVIKLLFPK